MLTSNGRDSPFTFQARGLPRNVEAEIAAAELSGHVFNLAKAEDFITLAQLPLRQSTVTALYYLFWQGGPCEEVLEREGQQKRNFIITNQTRFCSSA